jgi:uncharacterized protein YndB with AHSA1/START domain
MNEEKKLKITAEPDQLDLSLERTFDAPKELVFKAFAETELFKKWWGGAADAETIIDKHEPKAGGSWRFVEKGKDGEFAFRGVYHTFSLNEGIIQTFEWEGMPGHVLLESMRFEEDEVPPSPEASEGLKKTTLKAISVFMSQEDRDGMIASGMESGAGKAYDQLEKLLQKMQ